MGCERFDKTGAYIDGELPEAERAAFDAHLSSCAECSAEMARFKRLKTFLAAARMPQMIRPRAVFEARMNSQRLVHFAELLMSAAAIVIVVCGISLVKMNVPPHTAAQPVPTWERMALSAQVEPAAPSESDDPMVQVLLRDQP